MSESPDRTLDTNGGVLDGTSIGVAACVPAGAVPYIEIDDAYVVGANRYVDDVRHASWGTGASVASESGP